MFGGGKIKQGKKCNSLPNLLKLIEFGVIVQKAELQNIFDYFRFLDQGLLPLKDYVCLQQN